MEVGGRMVDLKEVNFALWQMVINTTHIMKRARQNELNNIGITVRTSAVLSTIIRLGNEATLSNIARQLVMEVHSISAQLSRMEKEGLIKKLKNPKKKNLISIKITDKGYELYQKGMERLSIHSVMSILNEEEQQNLWKITAKIRQQSMRELGRGDVILYPPSDQAKLPSLTRQGEAEESISQQSD